MIGGLTGAPFEEVGVVGEFFELALGGFGGGEIDGEPVAFEGVDILIFDPFLQAVGKGVFDSGDFFSRRSDLVLEVVGHLGEGGGEVPDGVGFGAGTDAFFADVIEV